MDPDIDEDSEEGANVDLDSRRKGKCAVIKTSTRQTIFLPIIGLVPSDSLRPGDLIGVNKDSYLILDKLPAEYDSRVKAMEVDERPTETYTDIGEWLGMMYWASRGGEACLTLSCHRWIGQAN